MNKRGFTLIEIIMVIVIFGIIMPGIMLYFMQGVKESAIPQRRTTAIFLAEALMEEIKSKRWDEITTINSTCSNASSCSSDTSDCTDGQTRQTFNDIDDFNNLNNSKIIDSQGNDISGKYPGYSQKVLVGYVDATDLNTRVAGPKCYKRIRVDITDTTSNEKTTLVSLMTYY